MKKQKEGSLWQLWSLIHGTHWQGAADFLVEVMSPGERTREKLPFYGRIGVVELLIVDREPWTLEQYHNQNGQLILMGRSSLAAPDVFVSQTVGLTFQLVVGDVRPQIQVTRPVSGQQWQI